MRLRIRGFWLAVTRSAMLAWATAWRLASSYRTATARRKVRDNPTALATARVIDDARREWLQARDYFDQLPSPDLLEHAAYTLKASERRYVYLLSKAKAEGFTLGMAALTMSAVAQAERGVGAL